MKILHKSFPLRDLQVKEDETGARTIEGWASTFGNIDSYSDIVLPGAFAASIKASMPKMLWQHNSDQPCGVWDSATETPQGLYVKGRFAKTPRGEEAYELSKMGAIDAMSIGYSVVDSSWNDSGIRSLKELDLWEVSLVTFPANDQARITTVKAVAEDLSAAHNHLEQAAGICCAYMSGDMEPSKDAFSTVHDHIKCAQKMLQEPVEPDDKSNPMPMTIRALEKYLRDAGFTQKQAKGIAAEGYNAVAQPRDAGTQELTNLFNLINQMQP